MDLGNEEEEIRDAIRKKYAEIAKRAIGKFAYPTGRAGALALGYDLPACTELGAERRQSHGALFRARKPRE